MLHLYVNVPRYTVWSSLDSFLTGRPGAAKAAIFPLTSAFYLGSPDYLLRFLTFRGPIYFLYQALPFHRQPVLALWPLSLKWTSLGLTYGSSLTVYIRLGPQLYIALHSLLVLPL
jgi:hypothetical protein